MTATVPQRSQRRRNRRKAPRRLGPRDSRNNEARRLDYEWAFTDSQGWEARQAILTPPGLLAEIHVNWGSNRPWRVEIPVGLNGAQKRGFLIRCCNRQ